MCALYMDDPLGYGSDRSIVNITGKLDIPTQIINNILVVYIRYPPLFNEIETLLSRAILEC